MITGNGPPRVGYSMETSTSLLRCASWRRVVGMTPTGDSSPSLSDAFSPCGFLDWSLAHAATASAARQIRNFFIKTSRCDRMTWTTTCKACASFWVGAHPDDEPFVAPNLGAMFKREAAIGFSLPRAGHGARAGDARHRGAVDDRRVRRHADEQRKVWLLRLGVRASRPC